MRRWWTRTRGLELEAYERWRATLSEEPTRPARILAWATGSQGELVVLSPAALSLRSTQSWQHVGWHDIERGGWNSETGQLRWQTYAGRRGAVGLPDPARVPAVFQERVAASLLFERFVPLTSGSDRGVVVNARRDLADGSPAIQWRTSLTRGVTWRTPGVQELADAALASLRHEYDER